jgi:hypothetical protein
MHGGSSHCGTSTGHAGHTGHAHGHTGPRSWAVGVDYNSGASRASGNGSGAGLFFLLLGLYFMSFFICAAYYGRNNVFIIGGLAVIAPLLVLALGCLVFMACREFVNVVKFGRTGNQAVTVLYHGSLAAKATSMKMHWGRDGWQEVADTPMTRQADGSWIATVVLPAGMVLNADFRNEKGQRDKNGAPGLWQAVSTVPVRSKLAAALIGQAGSRQPPMAGIGPSRRPHPPRRGSPRSGVGHVPASRSTVRPKSALRPASISAKTSAVPLFVRMPRLDLALSGNPHD